MGKTKERQFQEPRPAQNDEDGATLAAIDEGIRDARLAALYPLNAFGKCYLSGLPPPFHAKSAERSRRHHRQIVEEDAEAAARFGGSLLDHIELLSRFLRMGSTIRRRVRVRKLWHSPILVYYMIREDKRLVEILRLRHASRKPTSF